MDYLKISRPTQRHLSDPAENSRLRSLILSTLAPATFLLMVSYLCKARFWVISVMKNKYYVKIRVGQEIRVVVCNLIPKFEMFIGQ